MSLFQKLAFERSAHHLTDLPAPRGAEIAFAGRSNSGKSSAINALAGRRRLAFVSKTPGRTQQINLFRMDGAYLVDLPGYGYAKVPASLRAHWTRVLPRYLQERPSLRGMMLIMDIRHPLGELDRAMIDWMEPTGRPVHVLLSKSDKLSRRSALETLAAVAEELGRAATPVSVQLFSSLTRHGVHELEQVLVGWLEEIGDKQKPRAEGEKPGV